MQAHKDILTFPDQDMEANYDQEKVFGNLPEEDISEHPSLSEHLDTSGSHSNYSPVKRDEPKPSHKKPSGGANLVIKHGPQSHGSNSSNLTMTNQQ